MENGAGAQRPVLHGTRTMAAGTTGESFVCLSADTAFQNPREPFQSKKKQQAAWYEKNHTYTNIVPGDLRRLACPWERPLFSHYPVRVDSGGCGCCCRLLEVLLSAMACFHQPPPPQHHHCRDSWQSYAEVGRVPCVGRRLAPTQRGAVLCKVKSSWKGRALSQIIQNEGDKGE